MSPTAGQLSAGSAPDQAPLGTSEVCGTCLRPLVRRGEQGSCVYCLVKFVSSPEDDVLEEEPFGNDAFASGTRRYGHFEILAAADGSPVELGHGAMGTTYRAQDTVLRRAVALKVIARNVAEHPAARARFLREARAAAQFQHAHVAAVSQYGEQEGECFYVMELVEGETLEEKVRRDGPLSAPLALEVGAQVAQALAAAETRGIVHRDLKPSNIMLARSDGERAGDGAIQVKVIDFGLAKVVSAIHERDSGPGDTRDGFVGTPSYASPEQYARSEDVPIDIRSDIYSLGVTLWYLLCGKTPFVGSSLEQVQERQRQPLPWSQLKTARVPRVVMGLLQSMLSADPALRPQSARELLTVIHRCQARLPVVPRKSARVKAALIVLAIVMAAGSTGVWWRRNHLVAPGKPPVRSIAVLPFENLSTDAADAFYTTGLQDEVTSDLAHLPELIVTSPGSTKEYAPGTRRDLVAIGQELGVAHLLEGSCRRDGERMHVALRLVDVHDVAHPWARQYDRPLTDIFTVQGEIAHAITDQLQLSLSPAEKAVINRPPTRDLVAYQLYLQSKEGPNFFTSDTALRELTYRRIAMIDQAVARDPGFALAWCWLADLHDYAWSSDAGATPEELAVNHRALAEAALQKARTLQPDLGQLHLVMARHLISIHDDTGQASIEADLARRALPNNATAESIAADADCSCGRWDAAIRSYQRAVLLDPRHGPARWRLSCAYAALRQYENYDRTMAQLLPLVPPGSKGDMSLQRATRAIEARTDFTQLRTNLAGISVADDPGDGVRTQSLLVLKVCERDAAGINLALAADRDEIIETSGDNAYPKAWFQALVAKMQGDEARARAAFAAARPVMEKLVAAAPRNGKHLGLLAMIDAGLGRKDDAVREALRACQIQPYTATAETAPVVHCYLAVVYAWIGQRDLAFKTLDETLDHAAGEGFLYQPTYGDFRLNPIWDILRGDPRFNALVQRLAPGSAKTAADQ